MSSTLSQIKSQPGWLYSQSFDTFFIFGIAGLAILTGLVSVLVPALFVPLLTINLWIFAYHHVIATFTRLCFDRESHRRAVLLIYALFPAVFGAVFFLVHEMGLWVIATVYLYGQWFHYSRQSWGISRAYERNAPKGYSADRSWQTQVAFYGFPVWGILYRSYLEPDTFLTLPIKVLPVSLGVVQAAGAIAIFFLGTWLWRVYKDWKAGVMPFAYVSIMLSHFAVFTVAYLMMPTLDSAWIVANVWHNLQYICFVWLFNNKTYRSGVDEKARLLSFMSQRQNVVLYFLVTMSITTAIYMGLKASFSSFGIAALVIVYQTINFHHYIVDAIIWRVSWIKGRKSA